MNVAIIGTGNVGSALGQRGREGNRHARRAGARAVATPREAAAAADAVVIAVPYAAVQEIVREMRAAITGKVVIDATNPLKADYSGLATDEVSGAE